MTNALVHFGSLSDHHHLSVIFSFSLLILAVMVRLLLSCRSGMMLMGPYLGRATLMIWDFPHMQQRLQPWLFPFLFAWFCCSTSEPLFWYMRVCVSFVQERCLLQLLFCSKLLWQDKYCSGIMVTLELLVALVNLVQKLMHHRDGIS